VGSRVQIAVHQALVAVGQVAKYTAAVAPTLGEGLGDGGTLVQQARQFWSVESRVQMDVHQALVAVEQVA
jgi:hypothetical protein